MLNDYIEPCCENCRHLDEITNTCLELSRFRRKINNPKESLCDYHDYKDDDEDDDEEGSKLIIFQTCTAMEAVNEINAMLKTVGLAISEDNLIESELVEDVPDDWFEDYRFVFKVDFPEELLDKSGVDWDYEE